MVLSRPSKDSNNEPEQYWFCSSLANLVANRRSPASLGGFHSLSYGRRNDRPSLAFRSPLEHDHSGPVSQGDDSHEVFSPSARSSLSPLIAGLPHPLRSAFRFSQPLDGFLLKLRRGRIACLWHSWGLPFRVFPSKAAPGSRRVRIPLPKHVLTPSASAGVSTNGVLGVTNPKIHATQLTHHEKGLVLPSSPFTSPLGEPFGNGRYSHGQQVPSRGGDQQVLYLRTILSYT